MQYTDADTEVHAEQFRAKVNAIVALGVERTEAVIRVARSRPELHRAFLMITNRERGSRTQRLIDEKFEHN